MSRYFKPNVTIDELKARIKKAKANFVDSDEYGFSRYDMRILTKQIEKDFSKVDVDFENVSEPENNYTFGPAEGLQGYHVLPNGLTIYGFAASGDWQIPVYHVIYLDQNNKLRGYIPESGNPFNSDSKTAYGDDDQLDKDNIEKRFGVKLKYADDFDGMENSEELIRQDIIKRIHAKN